tara:strand:+ start:10710 stop:11654 length:945 start_codon:yes stop_codon:yes gene_type:complete
MANENDKVDIPQEVREALQRNNNASTANQSATTQSTRTEATSTQNTAPSNASKSTDVVQKVEYPTEVVDLPSRGWFYEPTSPLASGKIDIKYMTAREEDILTSQNLIKKGVVLDKLLEALIATPGVNLDDVLVGDKNAIFIAARILAYGKDYNIKFKDPSTNEDVQDVIDLSKIEPKEFDFENYERGSNLFEFELPFCKKKVHWSLLSHKDEQNIDAELKAMKKFTKNKNETNEVTTRLKYVIKAIDGNDDRNSIKQFVDRELLARDSLAFREHIKENTPDLDMTFNFESEDTGYEERMTIPLGVDFFYPSTRV